MSEIFYSDMCYCTLCDRYFPGEAARAHHVQASSNHPKCTTCDRRFANKNSLRNHYVYSSNHHYCASCQRGFDTAAGLRAHIEFAAVHRDDSDDDSDDESIDDSAEGWEDELGQRLYPEENNPPASSDEESEEDDVDYWTDDDVEDFEENQDVYFGIAPTPAAAVRSHPNHTRVLGEQYSPAPDSTSVPQEPPASSVSFSCPLCLEAPKESSATRCGHLFCTPCIRTALSGKKMCPVCRDFAKPSQLRKIYLSAA